ncbi:hypothetical protein R3X27_20315 [Tropicimonas sp. TH_r6]|uniref:hypothetical protein n=1 Tax=Tropicimonas sp. TH_r6 TaxID=3082085 RepID=UPI0029541D19|nr:hypothetical protein [Tropicimonas sp. TH_r6]MDV7145031.1 hypothetical protein [Tropicimonas sp. TH_r6]
MFASFLFALMAGFVTPYVERPLGDALGRIDGMALWLGVQELRAITFGAMLLLAALLVWLVGADSSAFLLVLGGLLGLFGKDIVAVLRDPAGAAGKDDDNWDGEIAAPGTRRTLGTDGEAGATREEETLRAVQEAVQSPEPAPEKESEK